MIKLAVLFLVVGWLIDRLHDHHGRERLALLLCVPAGIVFACAFIVTAMGGP